MKTATPEQIEDACMTRSSDGAWRHLLSQGLRTSKNNCDRVIALLIEDGRRGKLSTANDPGATNTSVERFDATMGSRRLLQATLNAFAMKAMRDRCSLEEAMATSLYAPATVAAWKQAA